MRRTLLIQAPAKVNLALSVGAPMPLSSPAAPAARAAGGLHPICSWMMTVNLFDDLHVTRLESDRISRYAILWHEDARRRSEINWSVTRDLAVRAHLALERHAGRLLPVQMKLEKRIPVGGGFGGGSSDAAAMLLAINSLFDLELSLDDLAGIGAALGSDVPFLVHGGSAIVEGVGDAITLLKAAPLYLALVFPDAACPTARVYELFDEAGRFELRCGAVGELAQAKSTPRSEALFNDLAEPAMIVAPRLRDDLVRVSELAQREAHITGSGSGIFVVCDDAIHAEALASSIEARLQLPAVAASTHVPQEVVQA